VWGWNNPTPQLVGKFPVGKVKIVPKNWANLGKQQGNNLREAVRVLKTLVRIKENIMPENIYQTSFTD
jgi:hypothetical protein